MAKRIRIRHGSACGVRPLVRAVCKALLEEFFANQQFTLKSGATTSLGHVTDWNGELQQITLAGLKANLTGEAALNTTLALVLDGYTLSSDIDASGAVIVGERVLVKLSGTPAVKAGTTYQFAATDVEIGRVLGSAWGDYYGSDQQRCTDGCHSNRKRYVG